MIQFTSFLSSSILPYPIALKFEANLFSMTVTFKLCNVHLNQLKKLYHNAYVYLEFLYLYCIT